MYDRLCIIENNERTRTSITNNLVPRAFPSEKGRGKKRPGNEFGLEASSYQEVLNPKFLPLSSACAEASTGYSGKNSNNRKIESARGMMGRGKRRELSSLFPLPIVPRSFSFSSPASYNTKRPPRRAGSYQSVEKTAPRLNEILCIVR